MLWGKAFVRRLVKADLRDEPSGGKDGGPVLLDVALTAVDPGPSTRKTLRRKFSEGKCVAPGLCG